MVRDSWLDPVYEGVPEILAGLPVRLASWGSILASGNKSSTWSDATDGIPGPDNLPFASVSKRDAGFVSVICANVSGDAWLEGSPYNTRWLVNLSRFLVDQVAIEKRRLASHVLSAENAFLSHAHADAVRVKGVLAALRGEHGLRTWLDDEQLIAGDDLTEELLNAIRAATMFLLFWSAAAKKSEWVGRELDAALEISRARLLVIALDGTPLPAKLTERLRIDGTACGDAQIGAQIAAAMQRARRRQKLAALRANSPQTSLPSTGELLVSDIDQVVQQPTAAAKPRAKTPASFTRGKGRKGALPVAKSLPSARESRDKVEHLHTIRSDYRIDILCFVDDATLHAGSGSFNAEEIQGAIAGRLIDGFEEANCQTGMDGSFPDHVPTRRHIHYGYHDVSIIHRADGTQSQPIECDDAADVRSAAFSPDGESLIVASTNYLTIARATGAVVLHQNMYRESVSSVAWQPSKNPIYATSTEVVVIDPKGTAFWRASVTGSRIGCVAVSPCARFIACSKTNGDVVIWNERGAELIRFRGAGGSGSWHASRALAFSPDSRFLVQAGNWESEGFALYDLNRGVVIKTPVRNTHLVAWSRAQSDRLATAADDRISFWRVK